MASLTETVKEVVFQYATGGLNLRMYALANEEQQVYAVNVVDWPKRFYPAAVVVMARIEGEQVIIEDDLTARPLVDALVRAGIAREQIILQYLVTA